MNKERPFNRSVPRALWFALSAVLLLSSVAQGMYDPHHGRWFQRDPLGVRPDAPRGLVDSVKEYADGMDLYLYARNAPCDYIDFNGTAAESPSDQAGGGKGSNGGKEEWRIKCAKLFPYPHEVRKCDALRPPCDCPLIKARMITAASAAANRWAVSVFCYSDYLTSGDPEKVKVWAGHADQAWQAMTIAGNCFRKYARGCCSKCPPPSLVPDMPPGFDPKKIAIGAGGATAAYYGLRPVVAKVCTVAAEVGAGLGRVAVACESCLTGFIFTPLIPVYSCQPSDPDYPYCYD